LEAGIVKICILASSSSGNSTFIASSKTRILIDAGLSRKETFERLAAIGECPENIDAVLVSHEHVDHVSGLIPVLKKTNATVYLSRLTAPAIDWNEYTPRLETFQAGQRLCIGDLEVDTFTIPHDAVDPVGFVVRAEGVKIGVATDLGYVPENVRVHLRGSDFLMLESNHDLEMLKVGPYPWSVKQRVMGRKGHLSNEGVSEFILNSLDTSTATLVLGHLSEHNNHPEIVRLVAAQALFKRCMDTKLVVADPRTRSEVFAF
jgi:phosphoribosyl 1,2-cyclic phosphodiesterase